jgi:CBS domain-containing protein
MAVNAVCNHNVATVERDEGIVSAAIKMRESHVGDLIVVEHRGGHLVPVGILTDRDIVVGIVAKQANPSTLTVGDVMSDALLTVHQDNGIEFALREMRRVGVRRAPVVGNDRELIGVLSIDDIIDHLAMELGHIAEIVRLEQRAETSKRP